MKTLIAVATKHTEADFRNTRLAKSLASHKEKQPIVSYTLKPTYQNTYGLCNVYNSCLLYTSPSPRDVEESRMPSSA